MYDKGSVQGIEILLVEDNPGDVRLNREALKDGKIINKLHVAEEGLEALAYLRREGKYHNAVRPELILHDLNLPKKDGREVLAEIKADVALKRIPVVILTSSKDEGDRAVTYDMGANSYLVKPVSFEGFLGVVRQIEGYWVSLNVGPPEGNP